MAVYIGRNAVRKLLYLFIVALARGIHVAAEKFVHAFDKLFRAVVHGDIAVARP